MPWKSSDAKGHTKAADTAYKKKVWSETANAVLEDTGDEGRAIRIANAQVRRMRRGKGS